MRTSDTISDILAVLSDGKCHTYEEIASEVGVCKRTIQNHVTSLSFSHPIETYSGQRIDGKRGIRLDISKDTTLGALTDLEKDIILKALIAYKGEIKPEEERSYMRVYSKFLNGKSNY